MMTHVTDMRGVASSLNAVGGCSNHHLQGAGAYCGGLTTGHTACFTLKYCKRKIGTRQT